MRLMCAILCALSPFVATADAAAQRLADMAIGRQVRIVSSDGIIVTGEFTGVRNDTVLVAMALVQPPGRASNRNAERVASRIALSDVQSHAIRVRSKRSAAVSAAAGAVVGGALALAVLAAAKAADRRNDPNDPATIPGVSPELNRPMIYALSAAGALIGSLVSPTHWRAAGDQGATRESARAAAGVSFAVRF